MTLEESAEHHGAEERNLVSPHEIAKIWQIRASTAVNHWVTNFVANEYFIDLEDQKDHLSLPYNIVKNFEFARNGHLDEIDQALLDEHKRLLTDFLDKSKNPRFLIQCKEEMGSFADEDLRGLTPADLSGELKTRKRQLTSQGKREYFKFFCELRMAEKWLNLLCEEADSDFWQRLTGAQPENLLERIDQRLRWMETKDSALRNQLENLFSVPLVYNPLLILSPDADFSVGFLEKLGMEKLEGQLPEAEYNAGYLVRKPLTGLEFTALRGEAEKIFQFRAQPFEAQLASLS